MIKPRHHADALWRTHATAGLLCTAAGFLLPAAGVFAADGLAGDNATPIYRDLDYSPAERAVDLVARMTPEERASQMVSSRSAAIPRFNIPAYGWWNEALHGAAREGTLDNANPPILINTTSYPVSLSLGSTWNPALVYQEARMIGNEMREVVENNAINLNIYSPTINLARDPRWGRNDEAFSEDPYLTGLLGAAFVNGIEGKNRQGQLLDRANGYQKTNATIKHYAGNNSEFNRLDGSSNISPRALREYYTAQFRDVIQQSQPASIMSAYNAINGTPAPVDLALIDTLARKTYGFDGFFTSDCDAIYEVEAGHQWVPPNKSEPVNYLSRAAYAGSVGEDLECQQGYHDQYNYANTMAMILDADIETQTGIFNENDVEVLVSRLLRSRIRLGDLDPVSEVPWIRQARDALNGRVWVNSNANNAITETPARLAMARAVASRSIVLLKNDSPDNTTPDDDNSLLPLQVPASGDYRIAIYGPYANRIPVFLGGYSSIQQEAGQANEINGYQGLENAVTAINPDARVDFYPGITGEAMQQIDNESIAAAEGYDAVVVYVGTDDEISREDLDRESLELPGAQDELINAVAARNPNTIVYMETVGNMNVTSFEDDVPAILWSAYNGMHKGAALADVLLGDYNPSGHLPFTWYQSDEQLPPIGDYRLRAVDGQPGRTYRYFTGEPTYHFGYGLSYTEFSYDDLSATVGTDDDGRPVIDIQATVRNTGERAGHALPEIYIASPDAASLDQPAKRLRAFRQVALSPGQSRTVSFSVPVEKLGFYNPETDRFEVTTGDHEVQLATSSADEAIADRTTVNITQAPTPIPAAVTVRALAEGDGEDRIAQRVIFPEDTEVVPRLAVALSDESVYGATALGQPATPLPDGMQVTYSSNHPQVLRVDEDGIHTGRAGVATLTATVAYRGHTVEDQYAIAVR